MAKNQVVDDPFNDDDWGGNSDVPDAGTSENVPDAPLEDRPQYIKPSHVGKAKTGTFELVKFTTETTEYSDVILLLQYRGRFFKLGMKVFSDDYKRLQKRFGKKRADWHGPLQYKVMPHKGNPNGYIAVK